MEEKNGRKSLPQMREAEGQWADQEFLALDSLKLIAKQMSAAISRCSRDLRYLWANQEYADLLQRPLDEIGPLDFGAVRYQNSLREVYSARTSLDHARETRGTCGLASLGGRV